MRAAGRPWYSQVYFRLHVIAHEVGATAAYVRVDFVSAGNGPKYRHGLPSTNGPTSGVAGDRLWHCQVQTEIGVGAEGAG